MSPNAPAFTELAHLLSVSLESPGRGYHSLGKVDAASFEWACQAFSGYERRILLTLKEEREGKLSFSVGLSIHSSRQAAVENLLSIGRCYDARPFRASVAVLHVELPWLMAKWEPVAGAGTAVFFRWHDVSSCELDQAASDVERYLDLQGAEFFRMIATPASLAAVLMNLENFPGRDSRIGGPVSASPFEYAAVLLNDLGRREEALSCLDHDRMVVRERVRAGLWDADVLRVTECKFRIYSNWIRRQ